MEYPISRQKIDEYKEWLVQHPIDPDWDEEAACLDGKLPYEEARSRAIYDLLLCLGELP